MAGKKLSPEKFVKQVYQDFMSKSGLESTLFTSRNNVAPLQIISASRAKVELELKVAKMHTNRLGILHGGTIAALTDFGGSLAVASMGLYATGVTTDLNVTYLGSGGKKGKTLRITAACDKLGQNLAYTTIVFRNELGDVTARGSHTKYIAKARETTPQLFMLAEEGEEDIKKTEKQTKEEGGG